tara:strand:+ start:729 stop:1214 length:486 start_codon:yes stop_codon:yes gene_type:complete
MRKVNVIVAFDEKYGIGKNNKIPWKIKEDLLNFQKITQYTRNETKRNAIIMGRKTWESLPYKPLKHRRNIIISGTIEGKDIYKTIEEGIKSCKEEEEIYIIGGKSMYEECFRKGMVKEGHISRIRGEYDCDVRIEKELIEKGEIKEREEREEYIYEYILYK